MSAIDVRHIVKKFGDFTAVNGITFGVEEGEIFGLLGPNGAGKSTLIRMLVTLLPPTSGTAIVNGFDVVKQADGVRCSIGVIPQAMTSDLELSVVENLIIFAKLYGVPRAKREKLIDTLLEAVELTGWRDAAHDTVFRIATGNGPATTLALMEAAADAEIAVQSLSVQSTTLDDVFVHYTGRALRDALQEANPLDRGPLLRRA